MFEQRITKHLVGTPFNILPIYCCFEAGQIRHLIWVDPFLHYPLTAPLHPSCSPSECQYTNGPSERANGRPSADKRTLHPSLSLSVPHPYALYRVDCGEEASAVSKSIENYLLSTLEICQVKCRRTATCFGGLVKRLTRIPSAIAHVVCQNCHNTSG